MNVAFNLAKWSMLLHEYRAKWNMTGLNRYVQGDYSRFVRFMKFALPALALTLLGVVVIWARLAPQVDAFKIGYAHLDQEAVKKLSMINARYFGIDQNDRPYSVTSDKATQRDQDADLVDLENPKADFSSKSGAGVVVTADRGVFHQHSQLLDLMGNVSLFHDQGYELHTEQATIDMKTNVATGDMPVDGQGPQGHLEGEGFRISDRGDKVLVTGRSSLTVRGAKAGKSEPSKGSGTHR